MGGHLSRWRVLELVAQGEPTRRDLEEVLEHLFEACDVCRAELEAAAALGQPGGAAPPRLNLRRPQLAAWARFALTAPGEAAEILALPAAERHPRISRAFTRFRNPVLADLLLEESRRRMTDDPAEAYDLAECAQEIALRLPEREVPHALAIACLARANAYRANALRIGGQLTQAERLLQNAVALFAEQGTGDPLIEAELLELSASLARGQRKLADAEKYLAAAERLYVDFDELVACSRVQVLKGAVLFENGDLEGSLAAALTALGRLDPAAEPYLALCAAHNAADCLAELGRATEARQMLRDHDGLYAAYPGHVIAVQRLWVEGKLDRLEERWEAAQARFVAVKERFEALARPYDAGLVSVDLAHLHLAQGNLGAVRELAAEMVEVFLQADVHREALAAVYLFQESLRQEAVSLVVLGELKARLRQVRGLRGDG